MSTTVHTVGDDQFLCERANPPSRKIETPQTINKN